MYRNFIHLMGVSVLAFGCQPSQPTDIPPKFNPNEHQLGSVYIGMPFHEFREHCSNSRCITSDALPVVFCHAGEKGGYLFIFFELKNDGILATGLVAVVYYDDVSQREGTYVLPHALKGHPFRKLDAEVVLPHVAELTPRRVRDSVSPSREAEPPGQCVPRQSLGTRITEEVQP